MVKSFISILVAVLFTISLSVLEQTYVKNTLSCTKK